MSLPPSHASLPPSHRSLPRISPRLAILEAQVLRGKSMADVGCDHGHIPMRLLMQGLVPRAIACDRAEAALDSARKQWQGLREAELVSADQYTALSFRHGNGLRPLAKEELGTLVIAGMGGQSVQKILAVIWQEPDRPRPLAPSHARPSRIDRLVLQPNRGHEMLRRDLL